MDGRDPTINKKHRRAHMKTIIKQNQVNRINITKPEAVTLGDCLLAHQMGYRAVTSAGRLVEFKKERRI
jgi:hypothetical protein